MTHLKKLLHFSAHYWRRSLAALALLVAVVLIDLTIPRLIQRIIDQGINDRDLQVVSGTTAVQRLVQVSLRIGTRAPLLMIGSLILMFITDSRLALMILPVLLVTSMLIVFFVSRMGPLFLKVQKTLDRLNTVLQENIAGVRVVKAFVRGEHEAGRFAAVNEEYTGHNVRVMRFLATLFPSIRMLVNIGIVIVIWAGGIQSAAGGVSVGKIVAFINYLQTTMGP